MSNSPPSGRARQKDQRIANANQPRRAAPAIDPAPQRQVRRLESAADLLPPPIPQPPASARTRLLGKMASMAELKHRKETNSVGSGGSGDDGAVGMRTFLGEDASGESAGSRSGSSAGGAVVAGVGGASLAPPSKEGNSRKKFLGGLFRRKKDGEK